MLGSEGLGLRVWACSGRCLIDVCKAVGKFSCGCSLHVGSQDIRHTLASAASLSELVLSRVRLVLLLLRLKAPQYFGFTRLKALMCGLQWPLAERRCRLRRIEGRLKPPLCMSFFCRSLSNSQVAFKGLAPHSFRLEVSSMFTRNP